MERICRGHPSRRGVFNAAGAATLAGAAAACGGDDPTSGETAPEPPEEGASGPLTPTSEVPVGGGTILEEQGVVVTRPSEGEFRAFSATCTHQGCTVSDVSDGIIHCACHGSGFAVTDGTVESGPAQRPLPEVDITVEDGTVTRV